MSRSSVYKNMPMMQGTAVFSRHFGRFDGSAAQVRALIMSMFGRSQ
jgi:hypothetical protein